MDEREHYLKVLIELNLVSLIKEQIPMDLPDEVIEKAQQSQILKFISRLPEEYRNMGNRDLIIAEKLNEMGIYTAWGKKKLEELKIKNKINQKSKSSEKTISER